MNENIASIQNNIRTNDEVLQNYLLDLKSWEKDMKKKEEEMQQAKCPEQNLPPIRNTREKKKNKQKKDKEKKEHDTKARIKSCDYQAWEKYNVDSELQDIDEKKHSSVSENSEDEEEREMLHRKQLAVLNKDKGNECFKKGDFDKAIEFYTIGTGLDPENPFLPANRAMAFIKKKQYQAAENDCTLCLSIDPTYVKAYLRRGTARSALKKISLAKEDFSKVLQLDPNCKEAKMLLKKLNTESSGEFELVSDSKADSEIAKNQKLWSQWCANPREKEEISNEKGDSLKMEFETKYPDSVIISPIQKSLDQRSKKPLMDIKIRDIISAPEISNKVLIMEVETKEEVKAPSPKKEETKTPMSKVIVEEKCAPSLPSIPSNSYQFSADWKKIKKYPQFTYQYLKQFPPEMFPVTFKHSMDTELFTDIIHVLATDFVKNDEDSFYYIKYLASVGRFQTLIMFLSSSEKNALNKVFDSIKAQGLHETELPTVLKNYGR